MKRIVVLLGLVTLAACGSSSPPGGQPQGDSDDESAGDPTVTDQDTSDDAPPGDTDSVEPTYQLAGFGVITAGCPALSADVLADTGSRVVTASFDLGAGFTAATDATALNANAQAVLAAATNTGNANSEAFAMELLARCDGAALLSLESAITYDAASAKADFSITRTASSLGVSVARAFAFPLTEAFTITAATTLLTSKAEDILEASANVSANVSANDRWSKQVLVVMAIDSIAAANLATAWAQLSPSLQANTILYVVRTDGTDTNIYLAD